MQINPHGRSVYQPDYLEDLDFMNTGRTRNTVGYGIMSGIYRGRGGNVDLKPLIGYLPGTYHPHAAILVRTGKRGDVSETD